MPDFHYVEEPDSLIAELQQHGRVGVDTEFMRERTFFAQLCLTQIATPKGIWCVDPLSGHPQEGFWSELLRHDWVLHSARQDIEVVYQAAGRMPTSVFDTQVAAGLLGYAPWLSRRIRRLSVAAETALDSDKLRGQQCNGRECREEQRFGRRQQQRQAADGKSNAVKGKRPHIVHSDPLSDKGKSPDDGGGQQQRI